MQPMPRVPVNPRLAMPVLAFLLAVWAGGAGEARLQAAWGPEDRWMHAYLLSQRGRELDEEGLLPLALASYSAALHEFDRLAADHPGHEPRLVAYRRQDLRDRMARAGEAMAPGDQDLAMLFEDFLETSREGSTRRVALDFAGSYRCLIRAKGQWEEVAKRSGEAGSAALAKLAVWIDETAARSREDLAKEAGGAARLREIEMEFALLASVAASDLPFSEFSAETESGMSSALFPDALVAQARWQWYPQAAVAAARRTGNP